MHLKTRAFESCRKSRTELLEGRRDSKERVPHCRRQVIHKFLWIPSGDRLLCKHLCAALLFLERDVRHTVLETKRAGTVLRAYSGMTTTMDTALLDKTDTNRRKSGGERATEGQATPVGRQEASKTNETTVWRGNPATTPRRARSLRAGEHPATSIRNHGRVN